MSADTKTVNDTKVALITGSARRIGASIAEMLHQEGFNIVIHYNQSASEANKLVQKLLELRPHSAIAIKANLQEVTEINTLCESTILQWGRLDLLINNASCFYPTPIDPNPISIDQSLNPSKQSSESNKNSANNLCAQESDFNINDWNAKIDTNLRAPYVLSLSLANELQKVAGAIINLVDIYADRPLKDHSIYNISKSGIAMMTQTLARELAPNIRVNGVSPGAILWPENEEKMIEQSAVQKRIISQTPLARCGTPEDICEAVKYLSNSTFVTGQIIKVDGGRSLYL